MTAKNVELLGIYLKKGQVRELRELREKIKAKHDVSISLSHLMRNALQDFLDTTNTDSTSIKAYLEYEGYI